MDVWVSKLSYWSGQNTYMKQAVFREAMHHPMTLLVTIIAYTARYKNHNQATGVRLAVDYATLAESKLAEYMSMASDLSDCRIIMALTSLALQEERYGDKKKAHVLMDDAMARARPRTGQSPLHDTYLHYVYYTMAPRRPLDDPQEVHRLLSFLHSAQALSQKRNFISQVPIWTDVFQFGSPLHFLLAPGPHPSSVPDSDRVWVITAASVHDTCRLASLIYVTATVLDHSNSPHACERFLEAAQSKIYERGLDRSTSSESLLWLFLEEPYPADLRNPWRAWFVGELMAIANKLTPQLCYQLGELLLRYLMLREPDLEISLEKFEQELFRFLAQECAGSLDQTPQ
jgi:hypothetical protein